MRMIWRMLARITDIKRRAAAAALKRAMCMRMQVLCEKAALLAEDELETKLRLKARRAIFLHARRLDQEKVEARRNLGC